MRTNNTTTTEPSQEDIARYAYYLWESEGCQHGRDVEYWLQARAHLSAVRIFEAGTEQAPRRGGARSAEGHPSDMPVQEGGAAATAEAKTRKRKTAPAQKPAVFA